MLSWNASSGLPEENHLFEDLFHFHDVFMHLGGLNPLMRCHEPRKVPNLTARFKASTPLRLPHLHIPRRSVYQESPQFKHGRRGNDTNCVLVLVFYTSYHDQRLKMGAKWPAFLGVSAWSDNIEGWILGHFTLARCGRTNSFAGYVLAFTGKSNMKCLNVP